MTMKVRGAGYVTEFPTRRPLKIYSSDPMAGRLVGNRITIDVPYEPLMAGPAGSRVAVVDYDFDHAAHYAPINLNDETVLMQGGFEPSESDPRFHQQMVYAVALRVIENFERALGRALNLARRGTPLRLFPHAFYGANAFYTRELNAVLFGYFQADRVNPGANLPGQNVFTCLSHDIIAHEVTHAVVDRLRRFFLVPSNADVLAFHEGFADIVALFQHFTFEASLRDHILLSRSDLRRRDLLVGLAQQFGHARGTGRALRSALDDDARSKKLRDTQTEPHSRGAILVAAVFDAFFTVYQRRIRDLVRIATGGSGNLPDADLHPDLINRIAAEASATAQAVLTMCIRAFDYLPPVDITFGDFLRGMVTADYELNPVDTYGLRAAMIDGFRLRAIYPDGVVSLAEESLIWGCPDEIEPVPVAPLGDLLMKSVRGFTRERPAATGDPEEESETLTGYGPQDEDRDFGYPKELHAYATRNAAWLGLDPARKIAVDRFNWVFRVGRNNQLIIELVTQFVQTDREASLKPIYGGLPYRGGTTVVASADGKVRYVIPKPIDPSPTLSSEHQRDARVRRQRQLDFIASCDRSDPRFAWGDQAYRDQRMALRMNFAALHEE